jgi:long-subunit fatty acid transport protein
LTDANSWNLCAGFGVDVSKLVRIDAGYDHAFLDSATASGNAFPGTYKTNVDFFSVGLTFRADL